MQALTLKFKIILTIEAIQTIPQLTLWCTTKQFDISQSTLRTG